MSRIMIGGSAGLMMMIAPPSPRDDLDGARRRAGKLVDVVPRARADALRRDGRDDLAVGDGLHARHRGHHRHGRLRAAAHHVHVGRVGVGVRREVHRRDAEWADGRGREVDDAHAALGELAAVLLVDVRARRVEGEPNAVRFEVGEQAVDALGGRLYAQLSGSREAARVRVDADAPDRREPLTSRRLDREVCPDVSGADDGDGDPCGHGAALPRGSLGIEPRARPRKAWASAQSLDASGPP